MASTTKTKSKAKSTPFKDFQKFIKQNQDLNLKTVNLTDAAQVDALNWSRLKRHRETILDLLPAYQRLLNIVPAGHEKLAVAMLQTQLHSALQIAAMPRSQFLNDYATLTDDAKILDACYSNALAVRSRLLVQYVNQVQQSEHPVF